MYWIRGMSLSACSLAQTGVAHAHQGYWTIGRQIGSEAHKRLPIWEEGLRLGLLSALLVLYQQWQHRLSEHLSDRSAPIPPVGLIWRALPRPAVSSDPTSTGSSVAPGVQSSY